MSKKKIKCDHCGEVMYRYPSHINENNYCSKECRVEGSKTKRKVKCDNCGQMTVKYPSNINDNLNFCSQECSAEYRRGKRVTITCDNCGKEIQRLENEIREHNFCGKECRNEWQSNQGNTEICDWCGKEFKIPPKEVKEHNFCCHEHYAKWLSENNVGENHHAYDREIVYCSQCGEEMQKPKWHTERRDNFFCDHECYGKWLSENNIGKNHPRWNGGTLGYRGPNWKKKRQEVLKRDNYQCKRCGKSIDEAILDIHHIIPFKDYKKNDKNRNNITDYNEMFDWKEANKMENLVTLCRKCHPLVENNTDILNELLDNL